MIELGLIFISFTAFFYVLFKRAEINNALLLSLGVVPAVISIELQFLYLLTPGNSNFFYKIIFILTAVVLGFIALKLTKKEFLKFNVKKISFVIIPILISLVVFCNIPESFDIFDPISYGILGKTLFARASLVDYPFVSVSREVFNFSWFAHPLGIPLFYSFLHLFNSSILINFVSSYYYFLTCLLVFYYLNEEKGLWVAILGTLLSMLVPVMVYLGKDGFIGPFRMFFFTSLIVVFSKIKDKKPIFSGFFTGLAMNTHLIGILVLPPSFFFFIKGKKINFKGAIIHGVCTLVFGGFAYINNILKFSSFNTTTYLSGFYPEFAKEFIKWHLDRKGIDSISQMLTKGILGPFTSIEYFGLFFWVIVILIVINGKKILKSQIFLTAMPFLGLFLVFHMNPSLTNTFHMDSRYIATFIPILTMVSFYKYEKNWKNIILTVAVFISIFVGYEKVPWFYKSRKVEFKSVVNYINNNIDEKEGILSRRFPFTQYYCEKYKTYSILDPKLSKLLSATSLNQFMEILEKHKIKYILTSRDDGHPFENKTYIKEMLKIPGITSLAFKTEGNGFWLFKIDKYKVEYNSNKFKKLFDWNVDSSYPIKTYSNKKNGTKLFLNYDKKGMLITVPFENSSSIVSFSKDKVWQKNVSYINVSTGLYQLEFNGYSLTGKIKLHPFVILYDEKGVEVKSYSGFVYLNDENKKHVAQFKKEIPFKSTEYLLFPQNACKAIIGINFYTDKGCIYLEEVNLNKAEE